MKINKKWKVADRLPSIQIEISALFTVPASPERTAYIAEIRRKLMALQVKLDSLKGSSPNPKKPGELQAMWRTLSMSFRKLKALERLPVSERSPERLRHDLQVAQRKIDKAHKHLTPVERHRNYPARYKLGSLIDERAEIPPALARTVTTATDRESERQI
jgi:hypothetical protein